MWSVRQQSKDESTGHGGTVALAVLVVLVGFALLQDVPAASVSLTTLHHYWIAYGGIKKVKPALIAGCAAAVFIWSFDDGNHDPRASYAWRVNRWPISIDIRAGKTKT